MFKGIAKIGKQKNKLKEKRGNFESKTNLNGLTVVREIYLIRDFICTSELSIFPEIRVSLISPNSFLP